MRKVTVRYDLVLEGITECTDDDRLQGWAEEGCAAMMERVRVNMSNMEPTIILKSMTMETIES
jgi:hypothetical protein